LARASRLLRPTRLTRRNQLCGLQFCLRGSRNVRLAAIWVADQNVVYLYGQHNRQLLLG
jgi:hypothetical protein